MPTKQDPYPPHQNTVILNPYRRKRATIPTRSYGLDHWTAHHQRKRHHTNYRGPRVLTCSNISTMQHRYHGTRNCPTIPRSRVQVVWTSHQDNQRPRPPIHITLWESIHSPTWNTAESIDGIPPPNRRPLRKEEPMGGAVPPSSHIRCTGRLDTMASACLRSSQQPEKHYHWLIAQSNPVGLQHHPKPWNHEISHQRIGRRKNPNHDRKTHTSNIGPEPNSGEIRNTISAA